MSFRFDLHVHTEHSGDARGSVLEIAEQAAAAGLHGFAITDHDTVSGHAEIAGAMEATGLLIIPGIEVTTAVGHVLALGCTRDVPKGLGLDETAEAIEAQGGVAIAAHPLRFLTGMGPTVLEQAARDGLIHAAEGINARERRLVVENTERLLRSLALPQTGGSDTHWMRDIGHAVTVFPSMPADAQDAVDMIRDGLCSAEGVTTRRRSVMGHQLSLAIPPLRRRIIARSDERRRTGQ